MFRVLRHVLKTVSSESPEAVTIDWHGYAKPLQMKTLAMSYFRACAAISDIKALYTNGRFGFNTCNQIV